MNDAWEEIGQRFKQLRHKEGLTLRAFCKKHHLCWVTISRVERGHIHPYSDDELMNYLPRLLPPGMTREQVDTLVDGLRKGYFEDKEQL